MSQAQIEAIAKMDMGTIIGKRRDKVYQQILNSNDGMTLDDLSKALGWKQHCISGRITELRNRGLVFDSGWRKEKQTIWRGVIGDVSAKAKTKTHRIRQRAHVIISSPYKDGTWVTMFFEGPVDPRFTMKHAMLTLELLP